MVCRDRDFKRRRSGVLTIGTRDGAFPEMAEKRIFRVVLVNSGHGVGEEVTATADKEVMYDGKEIRKYSMRDSSRTRSLCQPTLESVVSRF